MRASQARSVGLMPPRTTRCPRSRASIAAGPTVSQKIDQSGSMLQSHSLMQFGSFQSSIHSSVAPNRSRNRWTKCA
jgi:hypothetical protein